MDGRPRTASGAPWPIVTTVDSISTACDEIPQRRSDSADDHQNADGGSSRPLWVVRRARRQTQEGAIRLTANDESLKTDPPPSAGRTADGSQDERRDEESFELGLGSGIVQVIRTTPAAGPQAGSTAQNGRSCHRSGRPLIAVHATRESMRRAIGQSSERPDVSSHQIRKVCRRGTVPPSIPISR